jgi:hypothetical protein
MAWLLDSAFRVPGTRLRFGLDPLIGLVPGLGDVATALLSLVILVFGDAWDFFFKSNQRNLALLERHVASGDLAATRSDWLFLAGVAALLLAVLAIPVALLVGVAWLVLSIGR